MIGGSRAKLGAAVLAFLFAPAPGAAQEAQHQQRNQPAPPPEAAQLDPQVAEVARRLWGDLVCLCERCERLKLSACHCPDAAAERKNVLALLRGRDLGTPGGAEMAYQAVISDYVHRKGRQVLASEERKASSGGDWPALVFSVAVIALACAGLAAIELRRQRVRRSRRGWRR